MSFSRFFSSIIPSYDVFCSCEISEKMQVLHSQSFGIFSAFKRFRCCNLLCVVFLCIFFTLHSSKTFSFGVWVVMAMSLIASSHLYMWAIFIQDVGTSLLLLLEAAQWEGERGHFWCEEKREIASVTSPGRSRPPGSSECVWVCLNLKLAHWQLLLVHFYRRRWANESHAIK